MGVRDDYVVGCFSSVNGDYVGACVMDIALATSAGAALSLYPASRVAESLREGTVDPGVWENIAEVVNVTSRLFQEDAPGEVRVGAIFRGNGTPVDLRRRIRRSRTSRCYRLSLRRYTGGQLSLLRM